MLRAVAGGVTLAVRAQPGAGKTAIAGVYGEGAAAQLKIAVQAPPLEGRANEALIAFLSEIFGLRKSAVRLISGASSRSKVFRLEGVTLARAAARLEGQEIRNRGETSDPRLRLSTTSADPLSRHAQDANRRN